MNPSLWFPDRAHLYRRTGHWTDDTYARYVDRHASIGTPALGDQHLTLSWADVKTWTDSVACALVRRGLPRDSALASWMPNWVESYLLRIACEKAGLVWLPMTPALGRLEAVAVLQRSRACALVVAGSGRRDYMAELGHQQSLPELRLLLTARGGARHGAQPLEELAGEPAAAEEVAALALRSCRPEEVSLLLPTSGSTGRPKLCEYLLAGTIARGRAQTELFKITSDDVIVATLPGFGPSITPLLAAPVSGAQAVLLEQPTPETLLDLIQARRATIVCAVPSVYHRLPDVISQRRADVSSVRHWYSTAMQMPPALAAALEEQSDGVVSCGYGAVDLGGWAATSPDDPRDVRWHTVGRPRGGTEIKLVDESGEAASEGEIWGRGPSSSGGYFADPEATASAWDDEGWYRTGDLARFDGYGNLVILGRSFDVINRGGRKIFPTEIETLLERHPGVARAAVVPFSDDRLGQRSCAFVIPMDGARLTLEEIVGYLKGLGLATYKLPERLELVSEMPMASGWKISRRDLRAELEGSKSPTP